jgi:hypothetical protein
MRAEMGEEYVNASEVVRCGIPADWVSNFSQCLYDWQGLEAAGLALLAAGAGMWFVQRQIRQAQDHRADELSRRHNAARLTLPLALSAVTELVQKIADEVANEFEKFGPDGFAKAFDAVAEEGGNRSKFNPIAIPHEVLGSFEGFVASLAHAPDVRHVAELIGSIQILLSRYNDFDLNQAGVKMNLAGLLLDAAKVKLLNEKMFNYARFVDDSSFGIVGVAPPADAWNQIHASAQSLVFWRNSPDIFFADFQQRVQGYNEHNVGPWIKKFEA